MPINSRTETVTNRARGTHLLCPTEKSCPASLADDIQHSTHPLEAEDAFVPWEDSASYEPVWYMDLSVNIRREIEKVNWMTQE